MKSGCAGSTEVIRRQVVERLSQVGRLEMSAVLINNHGNLSFRGLLSRMAQKYLEDKTENGVQREVHKGGP